MARNLSPGGRGRGTRRGIDPERRPRDGDNVDMVTEKVATRRNGSNDRQACVRINAICLQLSKAPPEHYVLQPL